MIFRSQIMTLVSRRSIILSILLTSWSSVIATTFNSATEWYKNGIYGIDFNVSFNDATNFNVTTFANQAASSGASWACKFVSVN
jgi:hypothetical protein